MLGEKVKKMSDFIAGEEYNDSDVKYTNISIDKSKGKFGVVAEDGCYFSNFGISREKRKQDKGTLTVEYKLNEESTSGVHAGQIRMGGGFTVLVVNSPFDRHTNEFNTVFIDIDFNECGDFFDQDDMFTFNENRPATAEEIIEDFPFVVNGHLTITNGDD